MLVERSLEKGSAFCTQTPAKSKEIPFQKKWDFYNFLAEEQAGGLLRFENFLPGCQEFAIGEVVL